MRPHLHRGDKSRNRFAGLQKNFSPIGREVDVGCWPTTETPITRPTGPLSGVNPPQRRLARHGRPRPRLCENAIRRESLRMIFSIMPSRCTSRGLIASKSMAPRPTFYFAKQLQSFRTAWTRCGHRLYIAACETMLVSHRVRVAVTPRREGAELRDPPGARRTLCANRSAEWQRSAINGRATIRWCNDPGQREANRAKKVVG
jgi:hypothetical protein